MSIPYVSTTDHAALIRAALKAKGWNSRKISVRSDYYSLGSSIDIVIKDVTIPLGVVKAIAEAHERIRYCEVSGEILGGGNRYVSVTYDWKALGAAAKPLLPAIEAAAAKVTDNALLPIEGTPFLVGKRNGRTLTLWSDRFLSEHYDAKALAEAVVAKLADAHVA